MVEDTDFDGHLGTLEQLLVFNSANVHVSRCTFSNSPEGPALGFWQNVDNATVEDAFNGIYYSQSTNNLVFRNIQTDATTLAGIRGANQSDRGAFGATNVYNVQIIGGTFSAKGVCVQLGAVDGASVVGARFYRCGTAGLVINRGTPPANATPRNISVIGCQFVENNQGVVAPLLNPGLFINASVENLLIAGNTFSDGQGTPTQLYPITANGPSTPSNVVITGNRLSAYGGGVSIQTVGGANFTSSYAFANTDYKPSNAIPAGVTATKAVKGLLRWAVRETASPLLKSSAPGADARRSHGPGIFRRIEAALHRTRPHLRTRCRLRRRPA